jgi:histidinol phosphatase-like PHP family hydrolase
LILDLHLHTVLGSSDSSLTIEDAAKQLIKRGLDGACLTEHSSIWEKNKDQIEDVFSHYSLKVFRCIEINTNYGHVIGIGFDKYIPGSHDINLLSQFAKDNDAFLISAHPARRLFGKEKFQHNLLYKGQEYTPDIIEFSSNKLFEFIHGVEVLNGGNNSEENEYAFEAAKINQKIMTGGSDAHSESGVGTVATKFTFDTDSIEDIVSQLYNNQVCPVYKKDDNWIDLDSNYFQN